MEQLWNELNCPSLDIGDQRGRTNYIDFIYNTEHPIVKGIDSAERKFFVLRIKLKNEIYFTTFFQRYTDNVKLWMSAGDTESFSTAGGVSEATCKAVKELIETKSHIVKRGTDDDYFYNRTPQYGVRLETGDKLELI